MTVANIVMSN